MCCAVKDDKLFRIMLAKLRESGSRAVIESLISTGLRQNIADSDGTSLIHFASKYNEEKLIKFLIALGCDANVKNAAGLTPLIFAVSAGALEATKVLLENNANIFAVNSDGKNVLRMLQKTEHNKKIQFLKCFVDRMTKSRFQINVIAKFLQSANCKLAEIVCLEDNYLTRAFLQQNSFDSADSHQSIHNTIASLKMQQVRTLLTYGPFFKKRRMYFLKCILMIATKSKPGSSTVENLSMQILHWNFFSKNEISMIEQILNKANEESMKIILRSGIISHVKKCGNRDVFVHIFGNANPGIVNLIEDLKFDVNARGFNGQTALHIAVEHQVVENVTFLLSKGADLNAKDDDGENPMFKALWTLKNPDHSVQCVELLLLHGADIQACDHGGVSFIHYTGRKMNDLLELTLTHLALREAMGLPIEQLIYDQIDVRDRSRNLFEACRDKLQRIRDQKICDKLTVFSMITRSIENLCRSVNKNDCNTIANFLEGQKLFYKFYGGILQDRLDKIVKMRHLKYKAKIVIFESIEILRPYELVIDKIVSFFDYKDVILFE